MKHIIQRQVELGDNWIDLENEIYNVINKIKELPIITNSGSVEK